MKLAITIGIAALLISSFYAGRYTVTRETFKGIYVESEGKTHTIFLNSNQTIEITPTGERFYCSEDGYNHSHCTQEKKLFGEATVIGILDTHELKNVYPGEPSDDDVEEESSVV